jgi:prophage regulatory protein
MLEQNPQPAVTPMFVDRLLSFKRVLEVTSLSRATLYRKIGDGSFPAPLKIGNSRVAWKEREIAEWIAQQPRATNQPICSVGS